MFKIEKFQIPNLDLVECTCTQPIKTIYINRDATSMTTMSDNPKVLVLCAEEYGATNDDGTGDRVHRVLFFGADCCVQKWLEKKAVVI